MPRLIYIWYNLKQFGQSILPYYFFKTFKFYNSTSIIFIVHRIRSSYSWIIRVICFKWSFPPRSWSFLGIDTTDISGYARLCALTVAQLVWNVHLHITTKEELRCSHRSPDNLCNKFSKYFLSFCINSLLCRRTTVTFNHVHIEPLSRWINFFGPAQCPFSVRVSHMWTVGWNCSWLWHILWLLVPPVCVGWVMSLLVSLSFHVFVWVSY